MIYLAIAAAVLALLWLQAGAAVYLAITRGDPFDLGLLLFSLAFWPALLYVLGSTAPPPKNENPGSHGPGSEVNIR